MKRLLIISSLLSTTCIGSAIGNYAIEATQHNYEAINIDTLFSNTNMGSFNPDHQPNDGDVISFLYYQVKDTANAHVVNDLVVGTRSGTSTITIVVTANTTEYTGSVNVTYTISNKVNIATDITITTLYSDTATSPWTATPTKQQLLTRIKQLNPNLKLNDVDVDMTTTYFNSTKSKYQVSIVPNSWSSYYTGSQPVYWVLQKHTLAQDFTVLSVGTLYALVSNGASSGYAVSDPLNAFCNYNGYYEEDITNFEYSLSIPSDVTPSTTTCTITLTVTNNPRWQNGSITFTWNKLTSPTDFTLTYDQLNWSGLTAGDVNFKVNDPTRNCVSLRLNTNIVANNLTVPSIVTYSGTTYTINEIQYFGFYTLNDLTGSLRLPPSLTGALLKDSFRNSKMSAVYFDHDCHITGSPINETFPPNGYGGDVFYNCTNLTYVDFPATFNVWGREYFGGIQPNTTIVIRNTQEVVQHYAQISSNSYNGQSHISTNSNAYKVYVPDHLLNAYLADEDYQNGSSNGKCWWKSNSSFNEVGQVLPLSSLPS